MKINITENPFPETKPEKKYFAWGAWPVSWLAPPQDSLPSVTIYSLEFNLDRPAATILHVSGDEHYELFLDHEPVGRGSDSGDLSCWYFDSWQMVLPAGKHRLWARVPSWGSCGQDNPQGRVSLRPAFVLGAAAPLTGMLGTGLAPWKCRSFPLEIVDRGAVPHCRMTDCRPETPGGAWEEPRVLYPARYADTANEYGLMHLLAPSPLPEMFRGPVRPEALQAPDCDKRQWDGLLKCHEVTVAPHEQYRVVYLFENYCCAYACLKLSGGKDAELTLSWAEAAYADPATEEKGHRNEFTGKEFIGKRDIFVSNGCRNQYFEPYFWNSGRLVELTVRNGAEPLVLHNFSFTETHYPLKAESSFSCNDSRLAAIMPLLERTMQMSTHDVFMDCPYYERLMYIGDARNEALALYTMTRDERPAAQALKMFALSRSNRGFTLSRYPSRTRQIIPPYSLIFVNMLYDYALWRDNPALVRELLPRTREILAAFENYLDAGGLLRRPPGWNFIDWSPAWWNGEPRIAGDGRCGILNWQFVYALENAADLEETFGHVEIAVMHRKLAAEVAGAVIAGFWQPDRGLFADDTEKRHYSEHCQCLAALTRQLSPQMTEQISRGLLAAELERTTVYFSHYLFEAAYKLRQPDLLFRRLPYWFELPAQGFRTVPERPEPSRSDCHGWGAHPYYHFFSSILGIRPAGFGFKTVEISPMPGILKQVSGTLVHPQGEIKVALDGDGAVVKLPETLNGIFQYGNYRTFIHGGEQKIAIGECLEARL